MIKALATATAILLGLACAANPSPTVTRSTIVAIDQHVSQARTVRANQPGLGAVSAEQLRHQAEWPVPTWRATPATALGWSPAKLEDAKEYSERTGVDAVVVVHRGAVVAQWGEVRVPYRLRSVRKALLNPLVGRAVSEGTIRLEATLADLDIDDKDGLTAEERRATVRDLLTSSSGVYHPAAYEAMDPLARGSYPRGTFVYNNWDFNTAGFVYEKLTDRRIGAAFASEIAQPLGLEDFTLSSFSYRQESVSRYPAYLFDMSARDLARVGLLFARGGRWNDRQIVPEAWIAESVRPRVKTGRQNQYFGYLLWVMAKPAANAGSFLSTGNAGQLLYVDPKRDIVVVQLAASNVLWLRRLVGTAVSNEERATLLAKILAAAPDSP